MLLRLPGAQRVQMLYGWWINLCIDHSVALQTAAWHRAACAPGHQPGAHCYFGAHVRTPEHCPCLLYLARTMPLSMGPVMVGFACDSRGAMTSERAGRPPCRERRLKFDTRRPDDLCMSPSFLHRHLGECALWKLFKDSPMGLTKGGAISKWRWVAMGK